MASITRPALQRVRLLPKLAGSPSLIRPNSTSAPRKQVTVVGDDGSVRWSELSAREKTARATQQSFNFGVIVLGIAMTGGVAYLLYLEVFAPDSKTSHFNRAVSRIKADERCERALGSAKTIKAYGEPTSNKWARARPLASTVYQDKAGTEHLAMHFNVEGDLSKGVVQIHMTKPPGASEFSYRQFYLDVPGKSRIYLEGSDKRERESATLFGIRWK